MNTERIRELAKQAGDDWDHTLESDKEFLKKFAELIAAEERNRTWTQSHWTEYERKIVAAEREACAKVCEAQVAVYLKDGERWLKGKKGEPDTRLKDLAPQLEEAWEAEQLLKNKSGVEWITQAHKCAAAIRARGNE